MASWYRKIAGEISKLTSNARAGLSGRFGMPYILNSERMNYDLAKELYRNTNDNYKLGAGFAKPVINTIAGFMGIPQFRIDIEEAQKVLDTHFSRWVSRMMRTNIRTLRDGDCFVKLENLEIDSKLFPGENKRIEYKIIPASQVDYEVNPLTQEPIRYTISGQGEYDGKKYTIKEVITKDEFSVEAEGDVPSWLKTGKRPNPWGFIPIVHFKNEAEEDEQYGRSELEPIEPFMKAYHDVMLHAIEGSKMHSTPRLKFKLNDISKFLQNNFPDVYDQLKKGQQAQITLKGNEILLFSKDEDAEFIEVKSATGDTLKLLEFLFYCIVDTSEVPEFVFGVHTPSAHASVKEQLGPFVRRIARKREQMTEGWQLLARMLLAMYSESNNVKFANHDVTLTWDVVVERDEKEFAETLKLIAQALKEALEGEFISIDAAVQFLAQYIDTMNDYITDDPEIPGERERIMRTRLMQMRLEDGQFLQKQKEEIDRELAGMVNE
jgi:hypothetical protein